MGFIDAFSDLTASADGVSTLPEIEAFVRKLLELYELKHAVYYLPRIPGRVKSEPLTITTYSDAWVRRYAEADYVHVDPVVLNGFAGLLPVDWASLERRSPRVKQLFGEANEFGVGRQGLTFPIRGTRGEVALFNVTSDLSDQDWAFAKTHYMRDLQVLAHTVHAKALAVVGGVEPDYKTRLSPRELECLTWAAVGKTSEDIATILGISEGVVRIHLRSAQHKLNCLNRTHTVAKAMALNLIFPDIR